MVDGDDQINNHGENEVEPLTSTRFPNAGIEVTIQVSCVDCWEMRGEKTQLTPCELSDDITHGVIYECPECGKRVSLGKYNHGEVIVEQNGENNAHPNSDRRLPTATQEHSHDTS